MQPAVPAPEFDALGILQEEAAAVARSFGVAAGEEVGKALIDRLMLRMGGTYVYVPRRAGTDRSRVRDEVAARFNGANARQLAKELGVTVRYIRRLVVEEQEKR